MRIHPLKWLVRRLKRSEQGQSILLLALGFIALAAFVGLVTDISIMFVRFATLRRAVDSAAIAAAGQIREGTDYATVALAARQYILLHGLEPHRVWVETCETDIAEWRKDNPEPIDLSTMPETELCDWDRPRKLVRVVAQIDSETTFLKLVGINNFVLTSSSVSETAALDVALVIDTSFSMATDTALTDYTSRGLVNTVGASGAAAVAQRADGSTSIPYYCMYENYKADNSRSNLNWGHCCNDPSAGAFIYLDEAVGEWKIYTDGNVNVGGANGGKIPPKWGEPVASWSVAGANGKYDPGEDGLKNNIHDGNYSDLVCQPFKQVRDAARNFILRLDFARGDRVGLVTFDRVARRLNPYLRDNEVPMMNSAEMAVDTLDQFVGIYVNPIGKNTGCLASSTILEALNARIGTPPNDPWTYGGAAFHLRYWSYDDRAQCTNTNIGEGLAQANALLNNESTVRRDSVWVAILLTDGAANSTINLRPGRSFDNETVTLGKQGTPSTAVLYDTVAYGDFGFCPWYTFCYWRANAQFQNKMWYDTGTTQAENTSANPIQPGLQANVIDTAEIFRNWNSDWWRATFVPTNLEAHMFEGFDLSGEDASLNDYPSYDECNTSKQLLPNSFLSTLTGRPLCNDNDPNTRHFCLQWSVDERYFGVPRGMTRETDGTLTGSMQGDCLTLYDADDYARDMADLAGLVEIAPGVPGSFIAIFTIGFGDDIRVEKTAAPLLRYIADAGDNGQIDNNIQEDWRDNGTLNGGAFGANDPCTGAEYDADLTKWCGQYYYADNLDDLEAVFEAIASRLFTRISR